MPAPQRPDCFGTRRICYDFVVLKEIMMRRYICASVLAATTVLLSCHRGNKDALVGKWISVARAKDGTATVTDFRSDGTFTSEFQVAQEYAYRVSGNVMVLSVTDPKTGRKADDTAQVRIDGDTLYLKPPRKGPEEPMQRLGSKEAGDPPIVGRWASGIRGPHPVFAEFTKDGRMTFRQTLKQASGRYSVDGDLLTLIYEDAPRQTGKFRLENGILVLAAQKGEEQRLTRME